MNKYPPPGQFGEIKRNDTNSSSGSRKTYIDALNVVACISVVAMHQNGGVWTYEDSLNWQLHVIIETICYWAVPVFFMISGATLIGFEERYSINKFFSRRIMRTVVPFLFFSIVAYFFSWVPKEGYVSINELFYGILNTRFYHLYWFFIPLFWIYLVMPILTKYRYLNQWMKRYVLVLGFVLLSFRFFGDLVGVEFSCSKNDLAGPFFYVVSGYYLANITNKEISKRKKFIIYILGVTSFILRGVLLLVLSNRDGAVNTLLTNYYYPTTIFMAMSVFLFFKEMHYPEKTGVVLKKLSSLSLGIYLIHCFVISVEARLGYTNISRFIYVVPLSVITYWSSAIIVYYGKIIPGIKIVFP